MTAATHLHAGDVVLSAQGLVKRFGGITATGNVTLNLVKGARHALIGPRARVKRPSSTCSPACWSRRKGALC